MPQKTFPIIRRYNNNIGAPRPHSIHARRTQVYFLCGCHVAVR